MSRMMRDCTVVDAEVQLWRLCCKETGAATKPCQVEALQSRGQAQQLRRVVTGRHPNCRAPVNWQLEL
eukprot:1550563-Amphidinium_carterae.1